MGYEIPEDPQLQSLAYDRILHGNGTPDQVQDDQGCHQPLQDLVHDPELSWIE